MNLLKKLNKTEAFQCALNWERRQLGRLVAVSQPTVARCSMRGNRAGELGEKWCSEMEWPGSQGATIE